MLKMPLASLAMVICAPPAIRTCSLDLSPPAFVMASTSAGTAVSANLPGAVSVRPSELGRTMWAMPLTFATGSW